MTHKVTAEVFGTYSHGKLAGLTNPKQVVSLTMFGESAKAAISKINKASNGAFYRIASVVDMSPKSAPEVLAA